LREKTCGECSVYIYYSVVDTVPLAYNLIRPNQKNIQWFVI